MELLNKRMAAMPYWEKYGFMTLMLADLAPNVTPEIWEEAMLTAPKYGIGKTGPELVKAKSVTA